MKNFEIGDIVIYQENENKNEIGTVVGYDDNDNSYLVEFVDDTCFIDADDLEKCEDEEIINRFKEIDYPTKNSFNDNGQQNCYNVTPDELYSICQTIQKGAYVISLNCDNENMSIELSNGDIYNFLR